MQNRKRKATWVASCKHITTKKELIQFLESLPHYISTKRTNGIVSAIEDSQYDYIVWAEKRRFRVW